MRDGWSRLSTWCKSALALCLLCNALLWSVHGLAAAPKHTHASATTATTAIDASASAATASPDQPDPPADHCCSHAELHHLGVIHIFVHETRPGAAALVTRTPARYTSVAAQPPITPPIA
ncbi:hypothetical protein [Salinisphaera sp. Q1T1-3]|uniref:hypothetical protein n=1 Tax=Salinisphaera sp. Q1T1-3 TaxID=2321229 RepID=UPI000E7338D2|nr:hypothetical protein [Salinisphaera sp. Q1T1-3]RJS93707.1 hypothetical protein D3260_06460 [Salinisphaera sp. Q1T1-3]